MPRGRGCFFLAHSPLLGLINIVPQLGVVIATVVSFARVDIVLRWLRGSQGVLNTAIWLLNN